MLEATESSVERCARLVLSKPAATVSPVRSQSSVATVPVIELSRTGCVTLVAKAPTTCVRPFLITTHSGIVIDAVLAVSTTSTTAVASSTATARTPPRR